MTQPPQSPPPFGSQGPQPGFGPQGPGGPGQPMPGQPMPGQPMPGQPMPGQPMPPNGAPAGIIAVLNGQEVGPLSPQDLKALSLNGQLRSTTQVRDVRGGNWFQAAAIPGLFSDKEWMVTMLLSLLVGGLGVDRFYLGYTGLGVAKLLTCGGLGVWSIIDFILVVLRKMPDAEGRALSA